MSEEIEFKEEKPKRAKKKARGLKILLIIIIVIIAIIFILGFLFPGLLWTRNLGVTYTQEDYEKISEKIQLSRGELIDAEFTSEELTAYVNEMASDQNIAKNIQIKLEQKDVIKASGSVNIDYVLNELLAGKYSKEQLENEFPALGILPENLNVYLDLEGSIKNNTVNTQVKDVQIQGISISSIIDMNEVSSEMNKEMNNMLSGSDIEELSIIDGKLVLKGKL